jgi:hypothetical protein
MADFCGNGDESSGYVRTENTLFRFLSCEGSPIMMELV